ncbi:VWA domain-containing protein [Paenibacillus radicis (ex Xue et al. 2023)]|uniref:VWA domain-containing protein n=1 Tax=Paenibacillus radicis (ex Xue et al. 2023) TaxID=2972489 RepID=A0ABT1YQL5_9BACL|nr:VWA domain-containing protein [Paenibacillus radicis (ex Xue et al. 2023)]MCR8635478.1 VWA domain-containing protein [Paenibacillus radicis (ex Xue et al. 2023)]
MGLQFNEPWFLLLLLPLIGFAIWMWRTKLQLLGTRKALAVGLRTMILLLLILSLSGIQWFATLEQKAVYYVIDRSDSMQTSKAYEQWLKASADAKAKDDQIGVISTGLDAIVERSLTSQSLNEFSFTGQVNRQFSNLAQGLQLAGSMLPDLSTPRVVLLTDGNENVGDLLRQGKLLKDKGIPVDVLPLPKSAKKDVSIDSLKLPEKLYQGEKYTLEIAIASTFAGSGELRIYEENQEISKQSVTVERGDNRFVLQSLAKEAGFHRYRAELYFAEDEQAENNIGYAFSRVTGPPKVLVVEGVTGSSGNIESVLKSSFIGYEVIPPEMLSREMANYAGYDSIILNNVSATRISGPQMEMIETAVSSYGIGLMMLGGEDSYGMGGYFKTPIEKALPVYMDLQGKREIPSLGLILVIDRSGSMAGGKLELAKEAAMRTVELMRKKDSVGVVAFDSTPWWVVEPQKLTDRKKVLEQIQSIQPAGGTEIYTAVDEAYQRMLKVEAQRKHIILLTDGQSATNQSYEQLTENMLKNNMTLSSVAVGEGSDVQLLESIAKMAKGRFYYTNDQSTLPAIFSREAVMMARTYIVDQPFVPALGQTGEWKGLFGDGVPKINAYVAVTPKETAEVALMSPEPDPLLARWQYGSGRSVAWTSDITGKWSADWIAWDRFSNVFSQIIKWTFPQFQASPFTLSSHLNGNEATLAIKSSLSGVQGDAQASITDDTLGKTELSLSPTAPGEYESKLAVQKPGVYLAKIDLKDASDKEKSLGSFTTGFVIPYSPEYKINPADPAGKLKQLAELTGGRLLSLERPEEVFQGEVKPKRQSHDISMPLLIVALLLWLLDIAVRRLSIPWERVAVLWTARSRRRLQPEPAAAAAGLERLQQRKRLAGLARPARAASSDGATLLERGASAEAADAAARASAPAGAGGAPPMPPSAASNAPPRAASGPQAQAPAPGEQTMNRLLAAKNRKRR